MTEPDRGPLGKEQAMTDDAWTPLEKLAQEATAGPWVAQSRDDGVLDPWWIDTHAYPDGPEPVWAPPQYPVSKADAAYIVALVNAAPDLIAAARDGGKWRAAEAEGHVVTFTETGYGLTHPPSCRPDLIGCAFNTYLASRGWPDDEPGRYRMTLHKGHAEYAALAEQDETEGAAG